MTATTLESSEHPARESTDLAALTALAVRLVVGWTFFSAFWRRVVLENKLDPASPGYVGEKFNHFLPNSLGIKPLIGYLVTHPELLKWSMVTFTMVEAVVGLCVMLGLFTRLMSVGVLGLAFSILLGSGWLGTTCLDEWQIGILGVASGFMLSLTGGGAYSLDGVLTARGLPFTRTRWFRWLGSGPLHIRKSVALVGATAILALALFTNQYFHGGVYGPLHNKSIKPLIEISDARIAQEQLRFTVYRTEGVDEYGAFLVGISVQEQPGGRQVVELNGDQLSRLPAQAISNVNVAAVKAGSHSLVVPLGAKAQVTLGIHPSDFHEDRKYILTLTDISGATWTQELVRQS